MATAAPVGERGGGRIGWLVALIGLSVLLNYVDRGAIGIAAPLMKSELGLTATGFGLAVSAFFWVYAPMCLVVGWLCDRFCVYRVFALGVTVWALATFLTGFVGGIVSLFALRLLLGLGEAIAFPGSSKIFAAEVPATSRGMANAVVAAAIAFGPAVGTLSGGAILAEAGWRPIFWIFGAVTLLWLVPWHWVSRPFRSDRLVQPVVAPVPLGRLLRVPAVWLMGAAHFMTNYGFYFLLAWLPLYLVETRGYAIEEMTAMATAGFVAQGLSALAVGRWSDAMTARGGDEARMRRGTMIACQLASGIAIAGIFLAATPLATAIWLIVAGIAFGPLGVNIFAIGQMFGGPRGAGGWVGVQNTLGNLSGILGPILTGLIVDYLGGYGWAFAVAAGLSVAGALWWWLVIPPIREMGTDPATG